MEDSSIGLNCSSSCGQYPWVVSVRLEFVSSLLIILLNTCLVFIRTSKFCRGPLIVLNFWQPQPQYVLNFAHISVSVLKWEIKNKKIIHWKTILILCILRRSLYIYPRLLPLCILFSLAVLARANRLQRSIFCCTTILQDSVKFHLETFSVF